MRLDYRQVYSQSPSRIYISLRGHLLHGHNDYCRRTSIVWAFSALKSSVLSSSVVGSKHAHNADTSRKY